MKREPVDLKVKQQKLKNEKQINILQKPLSES